MLILGGRPGRDLERARPAGIAYAITGLARSFASHASRGKIFLPEEMLAGHEAARADILAGRSSAEVRAALADFRRQARSHLDPIRNGVAELRDRLVPALLPVALVGPYLARMERRDYEPFRTLVEVSQWRKQWLLWRAARDPRRITGG